MGGFTGSPYEYMMQEKPAGNMRPSLKEGKPRYPAGHKCIGCPYGRERPCMGACIRKLKAEQAGNLKKGKDGQ